MNMRSYTRTQLASAPRYFRHYCIDAIRRSAGHQSNDETGVVIGLALNLHGLSLVKSAHANKSCLMRPDNRLLLRPWCAVLRG